MSYLGLPRLNFAGLFEADVNTVNNDVRNYSAKSFEPRFQTPMETLPDDKGTVYNGWWNPDGGNTFRLIDCAVTGGAGPDGAAQGAAQGAAEGDPALSLRLVAQMDRTAAKIVDLDPQFQFASALWGLRVALTDGTKTLFSAALLPACFRDIYFGRLIDAKTGQPVGASPGASARFTGTLTDIAWGDVSGSPLLSALKACADANGGKLGTSLMTYGYSRTPGTQGFTFGSVIGTIGPWTAGEPLMFAAGRRFGPTSGSGLYSAPNWSSASGIGYMTGAVSADGSVLSLDFGNSLPLLQETAADCGQSIGVKDLGPLRVVVLTEADAVTQSKQGLAMIPSAVEGEQLTAGQYVEIGVLQGYDMAWLKATGGIADLPVPEAARALIGDHPLAILTGDATLDIRETVGGVWVRADEFVQRLDAAEEGWVPSSVALYAMRYGKPYAGAPLTVQMMPETTEWGGDGGNAVYPPQAEIPAINVPVDKIHLPSSLTTGDDGVAVLEYQAADPCNPRRYIDGQIYEFSYSFAGVGQSPMPQFELVAVHVRDAFTPPATPSWETDIAPVLVQFGNLYPVMSRGLFSFSDYSSVVANARLLYLAFTRPIEDPNYMPATRDMSAGKLKMIIDWLAGYLVDAPPVSGAVPVPPQGSTLTAPAAPVVADAREVSRIGGREAALKGLGPADAGASGRGYSTTGTAD